MGFPTDFPSDTIGLFLNCPKRYRRDDGSCADDRHRWVAYRYHSPAVD